METSPLICRANQCAGFYMITASVLKELNLWIPYGQLHSSQQKLFSKSFLIDNCQGSEYAPLINMPQYKQLHRCCRKQVKNFTQFTRKHLRQSPIFTKTDGLCNYIMKGLYGKSLSVSFVKLCRRYRTKNEIFHEELLQ